MFYRSAILPSPLRGESGPTIKALLQELMSNLELLKEVKASL